MGNYLSVYDALIDKINKSIAGSESLSLVNSKFSIFPKRADTSNDEINNSAIFLLAPEIPIYNIGELNKLSNDLKDDSIYSDFKSQGASMKYSSFFGFLPKPEKLFLPVIHKSMEYSDLRTLTIQMILFPDKLSALNFEIPNTVDINDYFMRIRHTDFKKYQPVPMCHRVQINNPELKSMYSILQHYLVK